MKDVSERRLYAAAVKCSKLYSGLKDPFWARLLWIFGSRNLSVTFSMYPLIFIGEGYLIFHFSQGSGLY